MHLIKYLPLLLIFLIPASLQASDQELEAVKIDENVWALVGPLTNRTPENLGNNANFGVIVTADGVILVDPGGSYLGAKAIHQQIHSITDQPVKVVINSGGQDHRWLGNSYFAELGAQIIASEAAKADQQARLGQQLTGLESLVGAEGVAGTKEHYADTLFTEGHKFSLGGVDVELYFSGQAHTPGDIYIWLPKQQVMFTGDIVYTERMLGIGSQSNSKSWVSVYEAMAAHKPKHIVPGHGHPTNLEKANADTYDYLLFLRESVAAFMEDGGDMSDISQVDQSKFNYLQNFDTLAGRNAQQVFTELEWE